MAVRPALVALALLFAGSGCDTAATAVVVKQCASEASEANSPEQIRLSAEQRGVPEIADEAIADAEEFKAYDWATCMMDKGWECDLSGISAPKRCSHSGTTVQNPFLD